MKRFGPSSSTSSGAVAGGASSRSFASICTKRPRLARFSASRVRRNAAVGVCPLPTTWYSAFLSTGALSPMARKPITSTSSPSSTRLV